MDFPQQDPNQLQIQHFIHYPEPGDVEINPIITLTFDDYTSAIVEQNNTNIYIRDLDNSEFDATLATGDGFFTPQDSRISIFRKYNNNRLIILTT